MKRLLSISCFLILLCSSVSIFSAEILEEFSADAIETSLKAAAEAAGETLTEEMLGNITKVAENFSETFATLSSGAAEAMAELDEEVAATATETFTKSMSSTLSSAIASLSEAGSDFAASMANLAEDAEGVAEDLANDTGAEFQKSLAESGLDSAEQTSVLNSFEEAETGTKTAESTTEAGTKAASSTTEAGANAASDAAKAGGETTKTLAQKVGSFFAEASKMIVTSVLMMVPSSIMTAIVAENTRNAMLATVATPVKWGTGVYQIPSCFINTQVPADSLYVYVRLPLASTTQAISSDMALAFPGLSGAGTNGAPGGDDITADYTVVGDNSTSSLQRYLLSPTFLQSASWTCTYPTGSAVSNWATTYINSTTAPGQIIDLNTGYVSVADGTDGGNSPVQLVGSTTSVLNGITDLYGDVQDISSTYTFTQYDELNATLTGDAADTGSDSVIDRLFNCACIDGTNADYSNVTAACQTTDATPLATCLLSSSIATLGAGTVIAADGTETDNWDLLEGSALTDSELAGTAQTTSSTGAADTSVTSVITQILNVATPVVTALITAGISSSSSSGKAGASGAAASTTATKTAAA
jgi:hypothetical protein